MSAVNGAFIHHVVKRGMAAAQQHFGGPSPEYLAQLNTDAQAYENAGPEMEIKPQEMLPVIITGLIAMIIIASIRYTVGEVMASLAMIESPSATAIIEPAHHDAPPAYADAPDAKIENEKEAFLPMEADADTDVEVTIISHKPITANVRATIGLLHRIGGFRARWRGLGFSVMYHGLHALLTNTMASVLGFGLFGQAAMYIFASVALARFHTLWTHSMISHPSSKPFYRRMVPVKQAKVLLLPSMVFAVAQQATFILPLAVAFALNVHDIDGHSKVIRDVVAQQAEGKHMDCAGKMIFTALRFLAVPATALFVGLALLLPAAVTLTRIEATLLPEDQQTIVPFDRAAIMGEIDTTSSGGSRALFVQAWRSFDRSARLRLVKVYAKMVFAQFFVAFIAMHLVVAEVYLIGGERLAIFAKSAAAQVKLMAIEAHKRKAEMGN